MASYIQNGQGSKLLLSDSVCESPLNKNARWYELDKEAETLEEQLDLLRTTLHRDGKRYLTTLSGGSLDTVRELRKRLSAIDAEQHRIVVQLNPKYAAWWGLN